MDTALEFLRSLAKIRTPLLDTVIQLITRLGEELIIFAVICIFYWCVSKSFAYRLGFTFFASGIAVQGLKVTCKIDRPWVLDPTFKPVGTAIEAATGYSFPSGHTQSATALYGTVALISKRTWVKVIAVLAVIGVAFSRMYLGVHTYFDVGVALILTFAVGYFICRFCDALTSDKNVTAVSLALALLSVAVAVYSFVLAKIGYCDPSQIEGCFKTGGAGIGFAVGYFVERKYINFDPKKGTLPFQIVKFVIGVAGALFFKSVTKLFLPDIIIFDLIRYFLTIFWVVGLYPLLFTAFTKRFPSAVKKDS